MTVSVTTVTGAAQTGLTTPGFGVTLDTAPSPNGKQWAVTSITGTQTGVLPHSIAVPFTTAFFRPLVYKLVSLVNSATGRLRSSSKNVTKCITRKGVIPLAGQPAELMIIETKVSVPAGADTADPISVRSAMSMHLGVLEQQSAGFGDTIASGIL